MAVLSSKKYFPSSRSKPIKQKEKDARIDEDTEPLSYSRITD